MDHSVTITANDSYNYYFNDYQSYNASALPPLQEQHQEGLGGIYSYNYNETSFHFTEWLRRSLFLDFDDSGGGLNATEGNDFTKGTDTQVLRDTLQVYGSLYVVLTALFCILRYSSRYNRFFNIRSWVEELQCEIAKTSQYGFVSWMWQVFEIDEEDILEQCGMDGLCFIRILRLGRKLSLTGCFHACWLIPVYATAEESSETSYLTDRLVKITTSNLPSSSPRFLATVICAYSVFGYCMYLLKQELAWYTTFRHKFLQQRKPRNYAVYVSGIPEELRSGPRLAEFFRQTAATSQVLEAHVTLACPELDNLVAQRDTVKKALKHAKAYEEIHGERERRFETQVSLPWFGGKKKKRKKNKTGSSTYGGIGIVAQVDSIESLERKLRQLTKDISFAYQNIERANDPHTLEEHRQMVMEEIEELHKAEVLQNAANRERAGSSHDVTQVEEIYHDPLEAPVVVEEEHTDSKDSFSEGVEKMFFGGLRKRRQQQAEERERFLNNTTEPARGNRVRIHTSENSVHSYNSVPSMEPISDSDDMEGVPAANAKDNKFEKPQFQRTFPSKSTITTAPGMFDDMVKNSSSDTTSSGKDLEQSNDHFRYPGRYISMPNIAEDQSGTVESITEQKTNDNEGLDESYVWRITREGEDSDNDEDDVGRSSRSWGSARDSSTRKAFRFLQRTGAGVGGGIKSVHEVGMNTTKKTVRLAGELGVKNVMKVGEFGVENIRTIGASAAAVVPMNMIVGHPEGKPLEAGFVVFKDLYTTQAALQMLHHEKASMMRASEAPGEDEIFWPNVGLPESAQRTGRLLSLAATTLLCFFWTIPVAFVSGLTEVNALKKDVDFLADWVEKFPGLENLLAVVAPLLLLILQDVILPEFLMWFAAWEGHVASSALEASVFVKYAAFVLVQTFFISAISGSITAQLTNILNEPKKTIDFLAIALPAQSTYFLQLLLVTMAVNMGTEMLRVMPLGLALARRFFGPRLTEEERKTRWKYLTPLEKPYKFEHANILGTVVLYFMIFLVYAALAPVSCFFIFAMFAMMESGYRYQFPHNYPATPDSGGQHWMGFLRILQCCLIVAQLTLLGFLLLKKSFFAVPFMSPLLAMTILFIIYVNKYQLYVTKNLPTSDCVRVDNKNLLKDMTFAKGVYLQPCIKEAQSDEIFEII